MNTALKQMSLRDKITHVLKTVPVPVDGWDAKDMNHALISAGLLESGDYLLDVYDELVQMWGPPPGVAR